MQIKCVGESGTTASGDILIKIEPCEGEDIDVEIYSTVGKQFSRQIKTAIINTLQELNVSGIRVLAKDNGALDYAIKARTQTAVCRAGKVLSFDWGVLSDEQNKENDAVCSR